MSNNQNQEPKSQKNLKSSEEIKEQQELSEEQLEEVSGGGIISDFLKDTYDALTYDDNH
ncbi:MAG: hypothetical protein ACRC80_06520 [Waterburya sp.]